MVGPFLRIIATFARKTRETARIRRVTPRMGIVSTQQDKRAIRPFFGKLTENVKNYAKSFGN